jgi:anti-sigma B factor antagonist
MVSNFQHNGDTLEAKLEGDLIGGADSLSFAKSLREALASAGEVKRIVINVRQVDFVNSSGLGMLLAARQTAQEQGATLEVAEPGEQLRSLLDITKLSDILGVTTASTGSRTV